eukprot:TRINITY_DN2512_c0_g1_i1.p1 TRINITY_DN2512_c0_g1~~TRINITY_DN2512_c0_g1_i1.p1  ORF type:complete len:375 (-),score=72.61 TRINITY_DN2512_c0_g1_i1:174-1298(-)
MTMDPSQTLPAMVYTVELTSNLLGTAWAWTLATQLSALRALVQEITETNDLPSVVVQSGSECSHVAIKSSHAASNRQEVICTADSIESAGTQFTKIMKKTSMISFSTENDRPGLLSEVTHILKAHGVNIKHAEISTDAASRRAMHVYDIEDASTGGCVPKQTLVQLEAAFAALHENLKSVSTIPAVRRIARPAQEVGVYAAQRSYFVRLAWPSKLGNAWNMVADLDPLRRTIKELTHSAELPAVEVQVITELDQPLFEVVTVETNAPNYQEVVCRGATAEAVSSEFIAMLGGKSNVVTGHTTVKFKTDRDRPGLLADVTALLKLHGANITQAQITTDDTLGGALHMYTVEDAATGWGLSDASVSQLQAAFAALR